MAPPRAFTRSLLVLLCLTGLSFSPARSFASDADAMDELLKPIALYPDALLAQILTAATSPEQVVEFEKWLFEQDATGSELQQAAMDAGFDAAFASLAIFPDVVLMMADVPEWTAEIGTAYLSSKDEVNASIQRLRAKAHDLGNLETNEQQQVTVENTGGTETIAIAPANPEVVYVPQYNTEIIYVQEAPKEESSSNAGGALLLFGMGIAIGAAADNDYYGWGAWGYGWHGGGPYYHSGPYMPPPYPRYPYARPVPAYRPRPNVPPPRYNAANKPRGGQGNRVDGGNRGNTGNRVNAGNTANRGNAGNTANRGNAGTKDIDRGGPNRGTSAGVSNRDVNRGQAGASTRPTTANTGSSASRGRASAATSSRDASSSAIGGYGSGSSTRAASSRGHSSQAASRGGGGGRGGGRR